ncbi:hypothetical protein D3C81_1874950 [compost metagenome]
MTFGPLMAISPFSPSGTLRVGSSASRNLMLTPICGRPQEPGLRLPAGVKVPPVQVSVMPQPSVSWQPVRALNCCISSTGSGAPPEAQTFSERRL